MRLPICSVAEVLSPVLVPSHKFSAVGLLPVRGALTEKGGLPLIRSSPAGPAAPSMLL